ncbi:hypothetical protein H6784_04195 [Candidatus Nomurabacteria bacterium]|nr:hypothetical protein [Candidatus Kaiserbacteria bacterium]MCB9814588.1 hypothetical protein [Candidatus Nomurabacteria bacterium]
MTLTELLRIGDKVVFKVSPDNRQWADTYSNVPDGTVGVVCGFYDAVMYESRVQVLANEPGVYHRKGAVSVWLADGRIVPGGYSVEMVDKEEEKRRDALYRDERGIFCRNKDQVRLGDLPPTTFWEGDKVRVRFPSEAEVQEMTIQGIDYHQMHEKRCDGSPYPFYRVGFQDGRSIAAEESWIELIERGNVWKYYHQEPLAFDSLKDESVFFTMIGRTEEVRNPETDNYRWTLDQALKAIKEGLGHGFTNWMIPFSNNQRISVIKFLDEDLGSRVAAETLKGFEVTA